MSKIFFTSDTHYHHKNIVRGTTSWTNDGGAHTAQNTRGFDTIEQMDDAIVAGINKCVGADDTLYHLGDWSFGGIDQIWELRKRLKCRNIHLVFGNHDHHIELNTDTRLWGTEIRRVQDLFNSTSHYKEISLDKTKICLSHYAHRVWNKSHHGSIMLYGHSHGTLPDYETPGPDVYNPVATAIKMYKYRTMDVGIDCAFRDFGEYRPYSWEEIKDIMSNRVSLLVDHHNANTN